MNIDKIIALSDFMREQNISVSETQKLALYACIYKGEPLETGMYLPIAVRYEDRSISKTFVAGEKILSLHIENIDLDIEEFSIPMSYLSGLQNCRQMTKSQIGKTMLNESQAKLIYSQFEEVNMLLKALGGVPMKKGRYWLSNDASKTYLAKAFDFETGKILELKRNESCRIRPVIFKI